MEKEGVRNAVGYQLINSIKIPNFTSVKTVIMKVLELDINATRSTETEMPPRPDWLKEPSLPDLALALLAAVVAMVAWPVVWAIRAIGRLGVRWSQHKANRG